MKNGIAKLAMPFRDLGGDEEDRTPGLGIANAALSQLSYIPGKLKGKRKNPKAQAEHAARIGRHESVPEAVATGSPVGESAI